MPRIYSKFLPALAGLLIWASPPPASAFDIDSASLEIGGGAKVKMLQLALQSQWEKHWFASDAGYLGGYWDASLSQWRGNAYQGVEGDHQNITVIGLTPTFRYQARDHYGWYGEAGIGYHLLSTLYNNNHKRLSTAFEFGDHLGAGYVFTNGWEIGAKLLHFSNGGIKQPNSGVNFAVIKLGKPF